MGTPMSSAVEVMVCSWLAAFGMDHAVRKLVGPRRAGADTWLLASLVVPGIGIALMMPLLVHLPFAVALGGADAFDSWAGLSITIVGPAHLALALLVSLRAIGLVRASFTPTPGHIYILVVAVSFVASAEFLFIPPILVAITGLTIVPLVHHMEVIANAERAILPTVPRAIALVSAGAR